LTKTVASAATLTCQATATQTVLGTLTLQGASNNRLSLRSSSAGTQWKIDPQATRAVTYVDVQDSHNINATTIVAVYSINSGNNINWNITESSNVWYDTAWAYRKTVTIDYTKVGATLTDFPALVSATDTNLRDLAQADGDDILFTSSDGGTKLSHELETYTSGTGALVAWVKIPTLSNSANTVLYLYYGNGSCSSQQNATNVWDPNYKAVWHLKESGNGTAGEFKDSTATVNHGQGGGGTAGKIPALTTSGKIGSANDFDGIHGTEDYISVPDHTSLKPTSAITVSAWAIADNTPEQYDALVLKSQDTTYNYGYGLQFDTSSVIRFHVNGFWDNAATKSSVATTSWNYYVGTYDGSNVRVYVNGVQGTASAFTGSIDTTTNPLEIGRAIANTKAFPGLIDEVRVSVTARSAGWITTEYNNQNSPSTFHTLGSQQAYYTDGAGTIEADTSSAYANSTANTIAFTYTAAGNGMSSGALTLLVPSGWSAPSTTGSNPGYSTASTGSLSVNSQTITVSGVTLTSGQTLTIVYGSKAAAGPGATATSSTGAQSWTTQQKATAGGTLTNLAASPSIAVNNAPDGSGTMTADTPWAIVGSTGNTILFTYTAANGGMNNGALTLVVPSGWSAPSLTGSNAGYTTASTGTPSVNSQTITVSSVTLTGGATLTLTYGSKAAAGPGATAPSASGVQSWTTQQKSTSGGTLTALASSPSIALTAASFTLSAISSPKTAGSAFNVVITAKDGLGATLTGFTGTVSLTTTAGSIAPTNSSSFSSGVVTQSVTVTKAASGRTLTVSDAYGHSTTSNPFLVRAGAFTKLQLLVPGEAADPGSAAGKTGSPIAQVTNATFTATVHAVDANWNRVASVTDTVRLTSSDGSATLPPDTALVAGTKDLSVTLATAGSQTLTASDLTNPSKTAHTSPAINVTTALSYGGWGYRKTITIDYTKVSATLTDFPVLIAHTDSDLSAKAQSDGDDLKFTASDGTTQLAHELESYTSGTGALVAWVKVPSLSASANTVLYLYYGNGVATNQQNPTAVWDANFKGVWHLKESSGDFYDSTASANTGTDAVSATGKDGKIASGQEFDGTDDYIGTGTTGLSASAGTVSIWAKADTFTGTNPNYLFGHYNSGNRIYLNHGTGNSFFIRLGSATVDVDTSADFTPGTWQHVALTWTNGSYTAYFNGASTNSGSYSGLSTIGSAMRLGGVNDFSGYEFDGFLDEVRVSDSVRSAAWLATEYNSQNSPSTFYALGAEQVAVTTAVSFATATSSGAEIVSPATVAVRLSATNHVAVTVDYTATGGSATGGGVDYTLASGTLTFSAGETNKNISIALVDDRVLEFNETILVTLSNPTNTILADPSVHTFTILDPPVAYPDSLTVVSNTVTDIPFLQLLLNDVYYGGEALTVSGVTSPTAQNGSAVINGANVRYTPPTNYTGTDTFDYVASGTYGTSTNTVTLDVQPPAGAQTLAAMSITLLPGEQQVRLRFRGLVAHTYDVQATTNVVEGPWEKIGEVTAGAAGRMDFDTDSTDYQSRYFRIRTQ